MTQPQPKPEFPPQTPTEVFDRISEMDRDYVDIGALRLDETFDDRSAVARQTRRNLYDRLPKNLTLEEVKALGALIVSAGEFDVTAEGLDLDIVANPNKVEVRALKWLGSISYNRGDQQTAKTVSESLRTNNGLRGKRAAFSLWFERNVSN